MLVFGLRGFNITVLVNGLFIFISPANLAQYKAEGLFFVCETCTAQVK
jgi:hypothetical protein